LAPVLGIVASLEETSFLQFVEQGHEPARDHAEQRCECLLTDSRASRKDPKDSGVRGSKLKLLKALGEPRRRVRPHLSQEKRCRSRMPCRASDVASSLRGISVTVRNRFGPYRPGITKS
jgi:hypothetical protein